MPHLAKSQRLSAEDYVASEDGGDVRHEYIHGQFYAMTGASDRHGLIRGNLFAVLHPLLRGTPRGGVYVAELIQRLDRRARGTVGPSNLKKIEGVIRSRTFPAQSRVRGSLARSP